MTGFGKGTLYLVLFLESLFWCGCRHDQLTGYL